MSVMASPLMYIGEVPWHGLGTNYETPPKTSQEIIEGAKLDWSVNALPVSTERHEHVQNYHAVYREDNDRIFGLVNTPYPRLVQNVDMFNSLSKLLDSENITVETAAALGDGRNVFGCFKISEEFKLFDDKIDHYLVVFNDHLKADGKITIMNTPVRVVCQNTLNQALSNNLLKYRIVCSSDKDINAELATHILEATKKSEHQLEVRSQKLLDRKITREGVEKLLDELFPYIKADGVSSHDKQNEKTEIIRTTFVENCLGADNLANYRGTQYQVFNAAVDFFQHYYSKPELGFDLDKRMNRLAGIGVDESITKTGKLLKIMDKMTA